MKIGDFSKILHLLRQILINVRLNGEKKAVSVFELKRRIYNDSGVLQKKLIPIQSPTD